MVSAPKHAAMSKTFATPILSSMRSADEIDRLVLEENGDLAGLTAVERFHYYRRYCEHLNLDWRSRPFDYLKQDEKDASGKVLHTRLMLYPNNQAATQLRKIYRISIEIFNRSFVGKSHYMVEARAMTMDGRRDEAVGIVAIADQKGSPYSPRNQAIEMKKAESAAKRRVTLSICGLVGWAAADVEEDDNSLYSAEYFDPPEDVADIELMPIISTPEPVIEPVVAPIAAPVEAPKEQPSNNGNAELFQKIAGWTKHTPSQIRSICNNMGFPASSAMLTAAQVIRLRDELFIDWSMTQARFDHINHARNSYQKLLSSAPEPNPTHEQVWEAWKAKVQAKDTVAAVAS